MNKILKSLVAGCMGNAVEFYSLALYAGLFQQITTTFLPSFNKSAQFYMFIVSCSYVVRPLGGLVMGWIGDQKGRKGVLKWSIAMVGGSNMIVGCCPGHEVIGIFGLIILLSCRFIQGFFVGAEYTGALIFGQEHVHAEVRSSVGGWISASCFWGLAMGLIFTQVVDYLPPWGWRVGFGISGALTVIALILREQLGETPEFLAQEKVEKQKLYWREVVRVATLACADGAATYTLGSFVIVYFTHNLSLPMSLVLNYNLIFTLITGMMCVLCVQMLKRQKSALSFIQRTLAFAAVLTPVMFWLLVSSQSTLNLIIFYLYFAFMTGIFVGVQPTLMYSLVPVSRRMMTVALGYNIGLSMTGGFLPMLMSFFVEKTDCLTSPGYILSLVFTILWLGARSIRRTPTI